jgi:hypothetical protein
VAVCRPCNKSTDERLVGLSSGERVVAGMSRAAVQGTRSGKPIGRPRIEPETEASIRAALQRGEMGMRKVAVQFGVATGTVQRIAKGLGAFVAAYHHRAGMRVGRSRPPPPPPPPIVATDWLPSTTFAVLLAFAHVTAVSKTTTTAKYFTAGDFMVRILSLGQTLMRWRMSPF